MTPGYYGDDEATALAFVNIGGQHFFRTGDVGEMVNGKINVIDRIHACFKLANGIFVAPAPLESMFLNRCPLISQVLVLGGIGMRSIGVVATPKVMFI